MKKLLLMVSLGAILYAESLNIENDFLQALDEVSEIATKTKLNIDDVPSFVTVLQGNKLKKLGIDNVFDALGLVQGVQLTKEASGVPVVIFRGVTQKGEVKLMVDGVTINNSYRGSIYYYLDFPIDMVERIEIIRGASSVLYGSGATSGVINIITKSAQSNLYNTFFVTGGSYEDYRAGAIASVMSNDVRYSIDGYYQTNNKTVFVGANPTAQVGHSDRHLDDYAFGLDIQGKKLSLQSRIKRSDAGSAYGVLGILDSDADQLYNINNSFFAQLQYKDQISQESELKISTGINIYEQIVQTQHPAYLPLMLDADYKERTFFTEATLLSSYFDDHELLLGARYERSETLTSSWILGANSIPPISKPRSSRSSFSAYINDQFHINDALDLSAGIRYDSHTDSTGAYSPSVGLVYSINEQWKLKTLYSHSFRVPSWVELTSNASLDPESSDTIEVGVVYKPNRQNSLRANIYKSSIKDMIVQDATKKYVQSAKNEFQGVEIEYAFMPNTQTEIALYGTYIDTKDDQGDELANIANALAAATLTYELPSGLIFGSVLKYVSSVNRASSDPREDMDQSLIFDQTLSYRYKNMTFSLAIKDLFDEGTYYALPSNSYQMDYDEKGRRFLVKFSMEF
jgi:iron complex outermembrane receptor protein